MENTDKAFAELIGKMQELIDSASGQLPDIAQQMLVYGTFANQLVVGIGAVGLIIALLLLLKSFFADSYDSGGWVVGSLVIGFMSSILMAHAVLNLYKISETPKLYLLDKAAGYVEKGCGN